MHNVLHICTDFWPSTGGIEQFVRGLAIRSREIGISASVLCFDRVKCEPKRLPRQESLDGIPITRVPFLDLRFYKPCWLPIRLLRESHLLHVHGVGAPLDFTVAAKVLHRRPIVVSTHGGIFHTKTLLPLKKIYFYGVVPWVMRSVDCVAACSQSDAVLFDKISKRVTLIENAVDIDSLLTHSTERKVPNRYLYVGRLAANKGIESLLKVFAEFARHDANFTLRLVGPDPDSLRDDYVRLVSELGIGSHVTFVGHVDQNQLVEEYQLAETFVSASEYEGFGLSAIEAKAAGCKVIVQSNEAFRSLFERNRFSYLVDFRDVPNTVATIQRCAANSDFSVQQSRDEVSEYSWNHKIHAWKALYESILSPR